MGILNKVVGKVPQWVSSYIAQNDIFNKVYSPNFLKFFEIIDVDNFKKWSYGLAVSGETIISESQFTRLKEAEEFLNSRVLYKNYKIYNEYITSLDNLISDLIKVMNDNIELRADQYYTIRKCDKEFGYRDDASAKEEQYIALVFLIGDLVFELTRILNSLLNEIRKKDITFLVDVGYLNIPETKFHLTKMNESAPRYIGLKDFYKKRTLHSHDYYYSKEPSDYLKNFL